jgi:hypothetical protein
MKRIACLILLLSPIAIFGQSKDWVGSNGESRRYPENQFVTGYGVEGLATGTTKEDASQRAVDNARSQLIQKIRVSLRSVVSRMQEETNRSVADYFSSATQATASLELQGLQWETDFSQNVAYAFAYAEREMLAKSSADKAKRIRYQVRDHLSFAQQHEKSGQRTKALEEYLACLKLFSELEDAEAVLAVVRTGSKEEYATLDSTLKNDQTMINDVRQGMQRVSERPIDKIEDIAWYIAFCLQKQAVVKDPTLMVTPLTYQDTKMSSPFARYFQQLLETKLFEITKWTVVQPKSDVTPKGNNIARDYAAASGASLVLTGTYWERGDVINFIVDLRDVSKGAIVASVEFPVKLTVVQQGGREIKPQNFAQAYSDQKVFNQDEVVAGGLSLDAWTNKGAENIIYAGGEKMKVYVRVNLPCYIRFVYHQADRSRVLLLDNYYIDQSKVNMVYEIPEEFECSSPYGGETLQIFARNDKFEEIQTITKDERQYFAEDLQKFMASTRGFKKAKPKAMQAESRVVITTMEK